MNISSKFTAAVAIIAGGFVTQAAEAQNAPDFTGMDNMSSVKSACKANVKQGDQKACLTEVRNMYHWNMGRLDHLETILPNSDDLRQRTAQAFANTPACASAQNTYIDPAFVSDALQGEKPASEALATRMSGFLTDASNCFRAEGAALSGVSPTFSELYIMSGDHVGRGAQAVAHSVSP